MLAGVDLLVAQEREQAPARFVVADHAGDARGRAEAGEIARHVGRAAGIGRAPLHVDHRHGRLGRDARDLAPEEFVQHQVADDEDAAPRKPVEDGVQPLRRQMHGLVEKKLG